MANLNLNKVILGGRLTAEPEVKQTNSGIAVCSFTVAVNRRVRSNDENGSQQQQADFVRCVAWRQQAEFLSRFFHKGSSICIVGSLQVRPWTDQNGQKRESTEVVCDEINFVDSKGEGPSGNSYGNAAFAQSAPQTPNQYTAPAYSSQANAAPKFEEVSTDDDLPF